MKKFDMQKFAREATDTRFRGRRRLSGNFGTLWINGTKIFEISAFECKVTANRDTVIIGQDEDSKITSLAGEGSFTIKQVFTRGFDKLMEHWKNGWDERFTMIGEIADPDTPQMQRERIRIENIWINDFEPMKFEKGSVVEKEIAFGFTPDDLYFENSIELAGYGAQHEQGNAFI